VRCGTPTTHRVIAGDELKRWGENGRLVFGLDANAYKAPAAGKQLGYVEFISFYEEAGLGSCWGAAPDVDKMLTTFNARTYLQPQLNKAVKMSEKHLKGDVNPKVGFAGLGRVGVSPDSPSVGSGGGGGFTRDGPGASDDCFISLPASIVSCARSWRRWHRHPISEHCGYPPSYPARLL